MDIKVTKTISNDLIEESKIGWQYAVKKSYTGLTLYAFTATVFILLGLIISAKTNSFFNIASYIGTIYLVLFLASSYGLYKGRMRWTKKIRIYIDKSSSKELYIEYQFNDSTVTAKDFQSYCEFKWTSFSDYAIYKDFLFIFLSSVDTSSLTINLNKMPQSDRSDLLTLVATKLLPRQK